MGCIDLLGFGLGHGWVRVGVKIFHPANDPDPDIGLAGHGPILILRSQ